MKNIVLLFILGFCLQFSFAQTIVSGTVLGDADGLPIPGATIFAKGQAGLGTVTDFDGKFTFKVPESVTEIKVTFVGMRSIDVKITGQSQLVVRMLTLDIGLKDVVVTAMGIKREKKSLGYSVQEVKGDDIAKSGVTSFDNALQGKVAGIEIRPSSGMPGASASLSIRGARSLTGNNQPLYVVDGMSIESGSAYQVDVAGVDQTNRSVDIDPNDIEAISVLKGPAAAALYGMRASNGVIIITTRSGKNLKIGKPTVNFFSNGSMDKVAKLLDVQKTFSQGSRNIYSPYSETSWGTPILDLINNPTYGQNSLGIDGQKHSGQYYTPQTNKWNSPQTFDNFKDFFNIGSNFNTGISISQAGALGDYSIGLNSTNQKGVLPSTGMSRHSARLSVNFELIPKLKIGANANYSNVYVDKQATGNTYSNPLFALYGAPSSYDLSNNPINEEGEPYNQINYRSRVDNPYWALKNNKFNEETNRFFGNLNLNYNPYTWLSIHYQLGLDAFSTEGKEVYGIGSNETAQKGKIVDQAIIQREINSNFNVTFSKEIFQDLKSTFLIGNEIVDYRQRIFELKGRRLNIVDFGNISNASSVFSTEAILRKRSFGLFENLALDYKSMLYLNLSGRTDIVSNMPVGHRTYFYPSASIGFVFSELEALKEFSFLSYAKIRTSYAQVGQAGNMYADKNVYVKGLSMSGYIPENEFKYPFLDVNAYVPSPVLNNPDLKPQNTATFELGTEFKFLNGRLSFEYTYSNAIITDQIFNVPTAPSSGYSQYVMNAGKIENTAHELSLTIIPIKATNYEVSISTNFSKMKNIVVELSPGVSNLWLGGLDHPSIRAFAGFSYPVIYGSSYLKDKSGRIVINDDKTNPNYGMPIIGKDTIIGSISPNYQLSFNLNLRYKLFTFSAMVDVKDGGQIFSGTNSLLLYYGMDKRTEDRSTPIQLNGVKGHLVNDILISNNEENNLSFGGEKSLDYEKYYNLLNLIDESSVYTSSYIKLRELNLACEIPKVWLKRLKIEKANLSIYARNIWTKTDYPNLDPETSLGNGNSAGGIEYMNLPQIKSFGFGLNLTF